MIGQFVVIRLTDVVAPNLVLRDRAYSYNGYDHEIEPDN